MTIFHHLNCGTQWHTNQQRLRQLVRDRALEVRIFSAHDPVEFELMVSS